MAATPFVEVPDILRLFLPSYERHFGLLSPYQERVMRDLIVCRTAELGGHRYVCDHCDHVLEHYNSCRNRHCPKCQNLERERSLTKRREENLNVYSKPPFGGAEGGLDYLGRYSHRVAISNHRLVSLEGDRIFFHWKDYRDEGRQKVTSLEGIEFVRRFLMHILPSGFQRIRSYGLLANRYRSENLERCRQLLGLEATQEPSDDSEEEGEEPEESLEEEIERLTGLDPLCCPVCGQGRLVLVETIRSRQEELQRLARAPPGGPL